MTEPRTEAGRHIFPSEAKATREAVTAALERLRAVVEGLDTDRDRELVRLAIENEEKRHADPRD